MTAKDMKKKRAMNDTNRVAESIAETQEALDKLNGHTLKGKPLSTTEKALELSMEEFYSYQETQSKAFTLGIINHDEAQTIYMAINRWSSTTDLATKIVVTHWIPALMKLLREW